MQGTFKERYKRLKVLGQGAFGKAYLIEERDTGGKCRTLHCAKEVSISHMSPKEREATKSEADLLNRLSHPNVIAYVDSFLEGPKLYIIMEYADGGDLASRIRDAKEEEQPFKESHIMYICTQLMLALQYIHGFKILHRDIKPMNIFITIQGALKLGDFGIARTLENSADAAQTQIGTPFYIAPEVVKREPYGMKSDLWALGVVTYEMTALKVPFHAHALPAVAISICASTPAPLPDDYSHHLRSIVSGLLVKDPSERSSLDDIFRESYVQKYIKKVEERFLTTSAPKEKSISKQAEITALPSKQIEFTALPPGRVSAARDQGEPEPEFQERETYRGAAGRASAQLKEHRLEQHQYEPHGVEKCRGGKPSPAPAHAPRRVDVDAPPAGQRRRDSVPEVPRKDVLEYDVEAEQRAAQTAFSARVRKSQSEKKDDREEKERGKLEQLEQARLQVMEDRRLAKQRQLAHQADVTGGGGPVRSPEITRAHNDVSSRSKIAQQDATPNRPLNTPSKIAAQKAEAEKEQLRALERARLDAMEDRRLALERKRAQQALAFGEPRPPVEDNTSDATVSTTASSARTMRRHKTVPAMDVLDCEVTQLPSHGHGQPVLRPDRRCRTEENARSESMRHSGSKSERDNANMDWQELTSWPCDAELAGMTDPVRERPTEPEAEEDIGIPSRRSKSPPRSVTEDSLCFSKDSLCFTKTDFSDASKSRSQAGWASSACKTLARSQQEEATLEALDRARIAARDDRNLVLQRIKARQAEDDADIADVKVDAPVAQPAGFQPNMMTRDREPLAERKRADEEARLEELDRAHQEALEDRRRLREQCGGKSGGVVIEIDGFVKTRNRRRSKEPCDADTTPNTVAESEVRSSENVVEQTPPDEQQVSLAGAFTKADVDSAQSISDQLGSPSTECPSTNGGSPFTDCPSATVDVHGTVDEQNCASKDEAAHSDTQKLHGAGGAGNSNAPDSGLEAPLEATALPEGLNLAFILSDEPGATKCNDIGNATKQRPPRPAASGPPRLPRPAVSGDNLGGRERDNTEFDCEDISTNAQQETTLTPDDFKIIGPFDETSPRSKRRPTSPDGDQTCSTPSRECPSPEQDLKLSKRGDSGASPEMPTSCHAPSGSPWDGFLARQDAFKALLKQQRQKTEDYLRQRSAYVPLSARSKDETEQTLPRGKCLREVSEWHRWLEESGLNGPDEEGSPADRSPASKPRTISVSPGSPEALDGQFAPKPRVSAASRVASAATAVAEAMDSFADDSLTRSAAGRALQSAVAVAAEAEALESVAADN
jgi:NIMA (never in mitosis gene a)-related kinase